MVDMSNNYTNDLLDIAYTKHDQESYKGVRFDILQKPSGAIVILVQEKLIDKEFSRYKEAYCYAIGYIDGCIEHHKEQND